MTARHCPPCSINEILCIVFIFILSGCGTLPRKNLETLQQTSSDKVYSSEREVLEKNPPMLVLADEKVDFSFSRNSPVVKTKFGITTAATVRFENDKSKTYLVVWAWLHKIDFGKAGVASPHLTIFDSNKNVRKVKLAQEGEEDACGISRCWKMAYDISELETGTYDLLLTPQVEDPEKIVVMSKVNTGVLIPTWIPLYGDYFGEARITLDTKLPFQIK